VRELVSQPLPADQAVTEGSTASIFLFGWAMNSGKGAMNGGNGRGKTHAQ